jgi:Mn-dependent DtxR family transcriptional regulator
MLADLLVEEYGIEREIAEKDAKALAAQWAETGLVE